MKYVIEVGFRSLIGPFNTVFDAEMWLQANLADGAASWAIRPLKEGD